MAGTGPVVVVGDLLVDVVVVPEGPLAFGSDTASSVRSMGGGAAANTACWLGALGRQVRLVASVGDDALGRSAVDDVEACGVAWAGHTSAERSTGTCVVLVDAEGERTMLPDRGANDALSPQVVTAALPEGPAWLHLSGYTLLGEGSRPAGLAAVAHAVEHGIPFSVDAASAAPLKAVGGATFLEWVDGCTVMFANDDELAALGGTSEVLARCQQLVAKHGADGASWTDGASHARSAALPVELVDTVGAGDSFDAGFVDAVLRGVTPAAALQAAAGVAAQAVGRAGARP